MTVMAEERPRVLWVGVGVAIDGCISEVIRGNLENRFLWEAWQERDYDVIFVPASFAKDPTENGKGMGPEAVAQLAAFAADVMANGRCRLGMALDIETVTDSDDSWFVRAAAILADHHVHAFATNYVRKAVAGQEKVFPIAWFASAQMIAAETVLTGRFLKMTFGEASPNTVEVDLNGAEQYNNEELGDGYLAIGVVVAYMLSLKATGWNGYQLAGDTTYAVTQAAFGIQQRPAFREYKTFLWLAYHAQANYNWGEFGEQSPERGFLQLIDAGGGGDCGFYAIALALSKVGAARFGIDEPSTVQIHRHNMMAMRALVADAITEGNVTDFVTKTIDNEQSQNSDMLERDLEGIDRGDLVAMVAAVQRLVRDQGDYWLDEVGLNYIADSMLFVGLHLRIAVVTSDDPPQLFVYGDPDEWNAKTRTIILYNEHNVHWKLVACSKELRPSADELEVAFKDPERRYPVIQELVSKAIRSQQNAMQL